MKQFKKGDLVTYLQNWDHQGTVRVLDLVVHSCGAKQMILVDEQGQKYQGRNFHPTGEQWGSGRVWPRLSPEAAEAAALALGADIVERERARMEQRIAVYDYPEDHGYTRAMRECIARLHEPRVLEKEG